VALLHGGIGDGSDAWMQEVDALFLGRKTYVIHANAFEADATLLEHDLVDEHRLVLHPVVLGGGKTSLDLQGANSLCIPPRW